MTSILPVRLSAIRPSIPSGLSKVNDGLRPQLFLSFFLSLTRVPETVVVTQLDRSGCNERFDKKGLRFWFLQARWSQVPCSRRVANNSSLARSNAMTPYRNRTCPITQRLAEDMMIRHLAETTIDAYTYHVRKFADFIKKAAEECNR